VRHAQLLLRSPLKGCNRFAQNELPRLQHAPDRLQEFLVERLILALEVQHGYRLAG
jgi:hypothetical protein